MVVHNIFESGVVVVLTKNFLVVVMAINAVVVSPMNFNVYLYKELVIVRIGERVEVYCVQMVVDFAVNFVGYIAFV